MTDNRFADTHFTEVTLSDNIDRVVVHGPDDSWIEVSLGPDGAFDLRVDSNALVLPHSSSNVLRVRSWPGFQPVVPPTPERPVLVSRQLVAEVMDPRSNGVGSESVAAVQEAVDANPMFRVVLEDQIRALLTKRESSSGYESVVVRQPCSVCGLMDTDDKPVDRANGVWRHKACATA